MSSAFIIVSYDIADNKRLRNVANCLEDVGQRVQYSVFECYLTDAQLHKLRDKLKKIIDAEEDKLRFYSLCAKDLSGVIIDGIGEMSKDSDYHII